MSPPSSGVSFFYLLVAGCLVVLFCGVAAPAAGTQQQPAEWPSSVNSSMTVELQEDGDAEWTVSTTFNLSDGNRTAAYQEMAEEFEAGRNPAATVTDSDLSVLGIETFERAVAAVDEHTDREMSLENRRRSTASAETVASGTGRLTVEFTWTNFARIEENALIIDDVLVTSSGNLWLQRLDDSQSLTIVTPEGYGVRDSADEVSPQEGRLRWEGPETFTSQSLQVTLTGQGSGTGLLISRVLMFGLLPAIGIIVVLVAYMMRVGRINVTIPSVPSSDGDQSGTAPDRTETPEATEPEEADDEIDEALLSDEERVERLLSENGGRMKQANIVKETDWSNAKVSQLLSSMEEEGRIDKLRIGRENLISFPEEDVTEIDESS